MLKKIYIRALILLSFVGYYSCSDDYKAASDLNDVSWYTSETIKQKSDEAYKVNVDSFISFMDLSQGLLKHEWIIEEGSKFLVNDFNYKNGNFPSYIDHKKGLTSNNATESVLFQKPGVCTVTLRNVFSHKVTSNTSTPIEATEMGNNWLFEKVFQIDVYDKLNPAVKIIKEDGTVVLDLKEGYEVPEDKSTWDKVELIEGEKLIFVDQLGGDRPDSRIWTINSKTYAEDSAYVAFPNVGTFSGFSIKSKRELPESSVYKLIPLTVTVKATTAPFVVSPSLSYINVSNQKLIYLQAGNGSFLQADNNSKNDFTVTAVTKYGNYNIPVENVEIKGDDNSVLKLSLGDKIYEGEHVKVSYKAGASKILSTNSKRELQNFDNEISNKIVGPSAIPASSVAVNSFELAYGGNYWAPNATLEFINLSTDRFYDGSHSLKVAINSTLTGNAFFMQNEKLRTPITPGVYLLSHYIYVESAGANLAGKQYSFVSNTTYSGQKDCNGDAINFTYPSETGKWVKQTIMVKYTAADLKESKIGYRFDFFSGTPGGSVFYIDKIDLVKVRDN